MKKVLVTGATGFIGNYVVQQLLQMNVAVIASSANGQKAGTFSWFDKVQYIPFQFETFDPAIDYYRFFGEPDLMIHLAWEGLPNYRSSFHTDINLPRHFTFLQNLVQHGLTDVAVTGTCFEYGMQEGCLREDMAVFPANPYAVAKNTLREQLQAFQQQHSFSLKWIRLFYMFGKGQNPNSLLSQLDKALAAGEPVFNMSGGEQVRDYLPVEKVAEYIATIALQNEVTGIINCCSGQPVKIIDFVNDYLARKKQTITLNLGYYPYPDYEPMRFWGDVSRLQSVLKAKDV
jgi:dTDP-6-deoxy-L-talose 4-dehydrogenase (NAD+)